MRLFRPGLLTVSIFPEALFRVKTDEKVLFLTFDDGPHLNSTSAILDILGKNKVRAVFFCSGKAASENTDLVTRIKSEGHIIGNHGNSHLNGFFTPRQKYLNDISEAARYTSDRLFRPPYGRLTISQYRELKKSYRIIMWDLMPYDFDRKFGKERSLSVLKNRVRSGSIIVFHDNPESTVLDFLDSFIMWAISSGYRFDIPK